MVPLATEEKTMLETFPKTIKIEEAAKDVISVKGMTLVLFSKTTLRAGFNFDTNPETGERYKLTDFSYEAYDVTEGGQIPIQPNTYSGVSCLDIQNIGPADLDHQYNIVVKKGDEKMLDITYSPFTYIRSQMNSSNQNLVNVVTAMYRYNVAAKAYQASQQSNDNQ